MIYITGDTHGDVTRFTDLTVPEHGSFCENDKIIVCGDFGFVYYGEQDKEEQLKENENLDCLAKCPFEILFVDGNHENFDRLESSEFPVEQRYGGTVRRIKDNIFWLTRGQIFDIEGKTFFMMGGAYSIDKYMRTAHRSWWERELPSNDEYRTAIQNLKNTDNQVDYIITHTCPVSSIIQMRMTPSQKDLELTGFLDWIRHDVTYKHWYFGHWHDDKKITEKDTLCWFQMHPIQ